MREKLDLIETRLQAILEDSLAMLFPTGNPRRTLARQLVDSMQANLLTAQDGRLLAPGLFQLHIHPSRQPFWQTNQSVLNELARVLYQAGKEAGFEFSGLPILQLSTDPDLAPQELRITAAPYRPNTSETSSLHPYVAPLTAPPLPTGAFLIIDGTRHFPLTSSVINIGRRPDNHLIIDDPRVSRTHAQIRASRGRFILFDLNSTGGTYVNTQPVTQQALAPGDVISLGGVTLIYSQDLPADSADTTTVIPPLRRPDEGPSRRPDEENPYPGEDGHPRPPRT